MNASRDDGFTLIELIIAVALVVVVVGMLSDAYILSVQTSNESQQRLAESQDADLVDNYFTKDVQSADTISKTNATCSVGTGTTVLALSWLDTGVTKNVTYAAGSSAAQLVRYACDSAGAASSQVVARELSGTPVAICDLSATASCTGAKVVELPITVKSGAAFTFRATVRKSRP